MWGSEEDLPHDIRVELNGCSIGAEHSYTYSDSGASEGAAYDDIDVAAPAAQEQGGEARNIWISQNDPVQLADVALVAALANTMPQLQHLEVLNITDVPDVWESKSAYYSHTPGRSALQRVVRAAPHALFITSFVVRRAGRLLPTVTAAAAIFATPDAYGSWLMRHHPRLTELNISTARAGWSMSWHQPAEHRQRPSIQRGISSSIFSSVADSGTAQARDLRWQIENVCINATTKKGHDVIMHGGKLFDYSYRPAAVVLGCIKSCSLDLTPKSIIKLPELLSHMRVLKDLEVCVCELAHIPVATSSISPC